MGNQERTGETRLLSIELVIALQEEGGELYQKVVRSTFPGREFAEIRERFIKRRPVNREKSEKLSRDYMSLISESLNGQDAKIAELQEEVNASRNRFKDAQNKFEEAKKKLEKAEQVFKEAQQELETAIQKRERVSAEYVAEEKKLEDNKTFILIHPSATLNQLEPNRYGIFVATKRDKKLLEKAGCVDMVFENKKEENFIENIPHHMINEMSTAKMRSHVAFANMIINFYLQEKDFVAIYSSKEISELLASNGYDISENE